MGCNHSRIQVKPYDPNQSQQNFGETNIITARRRSRKIDVKPTVGSTCSLGNESLQSELSGRGKSATSKFSKHSEDSGVLTEYDCDMIDEEYSHVITENSAKRLEVVMNFQDPGDSLDLGISGIACPRRLSAKDRERQEEQRILAALREEGLIARPKSRATGGLSFDVVTMDGPNAIPRPPPRLAKLEKRKKKKRNMTEEEIREKLEKAEQRRKKAEQDRLERIANINKTDINNALESFEQSQKDKEEVVKKDIDIHQENREKRFQEMKEKLKAKQEHAALVRKRKALAPIVPHPESELGTEPAPASN